LLAFLTLFNVLFLFKTTFGDGTVLPSSGKKPAQLGPIDRAMSSFHQQTLVNTVFKPLIANITDVTTLG
jgi:hypothetical protein